MFAILWHSGTIAKLVVAVEEIITDDLEAPQKRSITNNMKSNVKKCSMMYCGRLNRNSDYKLYWQRIRLTESEKDVGVIINSDMKFKDQVASAANNAAKRILQLIMVKTIDGLCNF